MPSELRTSSMMSAAMCVCAPETSPKATMLIASTCQLRWSSLQASAALELGGDGKDGLLACATAVYDAIASPENEGLQARVYRAKATVQGAFARARRRRAAPDEFDLVFEAQAEADEIDGR